MKNSSDPRHQKRIHTVQELFALGFSPERTISASQTSKKVWEQLSQIDALIQKSAPLFPIDKIARVDTAILRLAVYELIINPTEPSKVIIDEAVELAKELGGDSSPGFVNGVLGTILKNQTSL